MENELKTIKSTNRFNEYFSEKNISNQTKEKLKPQTF